MVSEAFAIKKISLKEIRIYAVEHKVINCGCAFAGVALRY
jgi:hypothetical protein